MANQIDDAAEGASVARRSWALKHLTALLEEQPAFSYLRMGDGELAYLLSLKRGKSSEISRHPGKASIETAHCCPGLEPEDGDRLLAAYQECSYLDTHEHLEYNRLNLPELGLQKVPGTFQSKSAETAGLLMEWGWYEMPGYLSRHKALFCGAEARLLQELMKDENYLKQALCIWGKKSDPVFVQPVENGLNLSKNLQKIKADIIRTICEEKPDTVFLSLGGAAKILCVDLSRELSVRCVDFGSLLRALTYSGSAGHAAWRASHTPFFFRVPFDTYMDAYEKAHPEAAPEVVLLKAHSQLCLELQQKVHASSTASDVITAETYDPGPENLRFFHEALKAYRRRYSALRRCGPECRRLAEEFDWWTVKKQLNWRGRVRGYLGRLKKRATGIA